MILQEVNDRHSESSTHGNLAVAYQAMKMYDKALQHYDTHLNTVRELKDTNSEARALSNLGNFYSCQKQYEKAVPYYEQYLCLSQELQVRKLCSLSIAARVVLVFKSVYD